MTTVGTLNGVAAACWLAAAGSAAASGGFVIRDVSIIDVERGRVVPHREVLIRDDRIDAITSRPAAPESDLASIDGSGLYLMPGLFDAHVHLSAGAEAFGPLLVANGVTCVRDMGAPTEFIMRLRSEALAGDATLPQIVCTGAIIDGDPPVWPFSEPCNEPAEAVAAVDRLAAAGVDQIKLYSLLKPEVFRAAVAEAHRKGLKAVGHVPVAITVNDAIDAGMDCIEHLTGFDKDVGRMAGWSPPNASAPWAWFAAWSQFADVPQAELDGFLDRIAAAGTYQCPTIVVMQGIGRAADPEATGDDPRLAYVPTGLRSFWSGPRYARMAAGAAAAAGGMQAMVGRMHRAGVPLMVGTDLANPYVFAGFSVHDELANFQAAGIPAADVLRAATIVPARFCGLGDELGSVAPGKVASLVLVRGNPLEDVRRAADIEAVYLRGRYFDRAALDAMLASVRATVAASAPMADAVDMNLPGEVLHRGRYAMKFQEYDAGVEDFVIARDGDGYAVRVHSRPKGGPQLPFVLTCHAGPDRTFRSAQWRVLSAEGLEAAYTVEGDAFHAAARKAGEKLPEQVLPVPVDALVATPANATEFLTIGGSGLAAGESRAYQSVGFGFPSWELAVTPYTLTRAADTSLDLDGRVIPARHYTWRMPTSWGEFTGESWTDDSGFMVKSITRMPFGTITAQLQPAD